MSVLSPDNLSKEDQLKQSLAFQRRLNALFQRIQSAESIYSIVPEIEPELLTILQADRLTIYHRSKDDKEIVSHFQSGPGMREIRVPLTPTSVAGYCALSQRALIIHDVYDKEELRKIHEDLSFDSSFDLKSGYRTRSMMVLPIKYGDIMLGVMQVLNRIDGGSFLNDDMERAHEVAGIMGKKFRYELGGTTHPYEQLVKSNKISAEQLEELERQAASSNQTLSSLLVNEKNIAIADIGASLEMYYQVPFMPYLPEVEPPAELFKNLNEAYLRNQCWIPIEGDRQNAVILIDNPSDSNRIMEIQSVLGARNLEFRVSTTEEILKYLGIGLQTADDPAALDDLMGKLAEEVEETDEAKDALSDEANENEATIIQLVNRLLSDAHACGASDIHIEPGKRQTPSIVRVRVDGVCRKMFDIPATHIRAVVARIKVMSSLDISERRKPQDGKCMLKIKGQVVEMRVATVPTVNGESVVLRILASAGALPIDKLNLSKSTLQRTIDMVVRPHGVFLVVGPTGSGKTTTLHAILGHINTPERKIWTAEDPVEITQPGLQQVQVIPKIGFTFAAALRSFLRADPDVILIGEMRDQETASIGIEASLTGHLVFSTLHTNSAPETITRLLDLGIEPVNFADALLGVLAQRLVRTLCPECKEEYVPDEEEFSKIAHAYDETLFPELEVKRESVTLARAVGCEKCGGSGYKGRTGIHELLVASEGLRRAIVTGASVEEIKNIAMTEGMRSLFQDGIGKLLKGQIDMQQLRRVVAE